MKSFLKSLKKEIQCSLCNDTLNEPKILKCFHTFCKLCIKRHTELIGEINVFKCPKCLSEVRLQKLSSVDELKPSLLHARILKAFEFIESEKVCSVSDSHPTASVHCFDCDRSLCEKCQEYHSVLMKNHKVLSLTDSESCEEGIRLMLSRESHCLGHTDKRVELYCKDCEKAICLECLRHDHDGHLTVLLEKFLSTKRSFLSEQVEQLKLQESEMQEETRVMEEKANKMRDNYEKIKLEVKERSQRIINAVQQNAEEILGQIDKEIHKTEQKKVEARSVVYQTRGTIEYIDNVIEKGLASELIGKGLIEIDNIKSFEMQVVNKGLGLVVFDSNEELMKQVNLGLGTIQTADQAGGFMVGSVRIECTGQLDTPKGRPQIMVEKKFEMKGFAKVKSPPCFTGIAVNKENKRIAVADSSNNCVYILSMDGDLLRSYDGKGSGYGPLSDPQGLAFLHKRHLVISDCNNHRICIVNSKTGKLLKTFGKEGKEEGEFCHPCHVHVDEDLNIIVSDLGNSRIQIFTKDGDFQSQICSAGQFTLNPQATISHNGLIYISDANINVIHVFKMEGNIPTRISTIGEGGSTDGLLSDPCGLAIDNEGNLLVCNSGINSIQKFTLDGSFVMKTCKEIKTLCDIAILKDGRCLVSCLESGIFYIR